MHQIRFWLRLHPRHRWRSSQRSPRLPNLILGGPISKGGEGQVGEGRWGKGRWGPPNWNFWLRHWGGDKFFLKIAWRHLRKTPILVVWTDTTPWANKKCGTFPLSTSLPIIDRFSKFFHWHTLRTICNNVIIIHLTTPQMCHYTTLQNTKHKCK